LRRKDTLLKKNEVLRISGTAFAILVCCIALLTSGEKAFAASIPSSHHTTKITIHMHIVGQIVGTGATAHRITPQGISDDNCGTLEFYIDDYDYGEAGFWMYVSSDVGPILELSYGVEWENLSRDTSDSFGNTYGPVGNPWFIEPTRYTKSGLVTGNISASDVAGIDFCTGYQSDSANIT
jgi:hypothetical protein